MTNRPKVKGIRMCLRCKGICHEKSLRNRRISRRSRSHYFDNKHCLVQYHARRVAKHVPRRSRDMDRIEKRSEGWVDEMIKDGTYEYVDVITP